MLVDGRSKTNTLPLPRDVHSGPVRQFQWIHYRSETNKWLISALAVHLVIEAFFFFVCRDISHNQLEMIGRKTLRGISALKNL